MTRRIPVPLATLAIAMLATAPAFAQTAVAANTAKAPAAGAKKFTAPRGADGHADLSGTWTNSTTVPLERPKDLGAKEFYTEEEIAANAKRAAERAAAQAAQAEAGDLAVHYDTSQFALTGAQTKRAPSLRTSLITGADGRIPAMLPVAAKRQADRQAAVPRAKQFDSYEFRPLAERCYFWNNEGPPMLPAGYNANLQIVQGPGYVAIEQEMIHDVRIIPTDGSPHLPSNIRQWFGDARGHWEGDTLVVETTNFTDRTAFRGSSDQLKVVERFSRSSADAIVYQFTVTDPATWEKSWSAEIQMSKIDGGLYEYACHEGNYGMSNILSGARADEAKAAAAKK